MAKKIDPKKMTPQELEEYVSKLPEKTPPRWSSVGWLALFSLLAVILSIIQFNGGTATITTWLTLIGGIGGFAGTGYLIYKILTFNQNP